MIMTRIKVMLTTSIHYNYCWIPKANNTTEFIGFTPNGSSMHFDLSTKKQFSIFATATVKSLQSYLTLCNPKDGSPPGSPVPGILQARTLQWVAISFSNMWNWKVTVKSLSRVRLSATPWTTAYQAPPSMGFSRQDYWSGVPLPSLFYSLSMIKDFLLLW